MDRYLCEPCGYVYDPKVGDPDHDIPAGTAFEDLPDDWVCPWCGLGKDVFVKEQEKMPLKQKRKDALGAFFQLIGAFGFWNIIPGVYFYYLWRIDCGHGFLCVIMTQRA